jgi:uncharacterized coiled-coil protein SlyX
MRRLVLIVIALTVLLLVPAAASASTPTLKSLAKSLAALQKTQKSQAATIKSLQGKGASGTSTIAALQSTVAGQAATIASLQGTVTSQASTIAGLQSTVTSQTDTIVGLQTVVGADTSHGLRKSVADIAANPALTLSWLPTYLSLDSNAENGVAGPNVVFQACNVHVFSATSEDDTTGLGNLIVGWDGTSGGQRGGSNNLVCGEGNNFSSYGCFVAGNLNAVGGPCASVCGGMDNQATKNVSSVDGGYNNLAGNNGDIIGGGENITLNSPSIGYAWQAGTYHTP